MQIIYLGTIIEAIGFALDVRHHLLEGLRKPEQLLTPSHSIILIGFAIHLAGVLIIIFSKKLRA